MSKLIRLTENDLKEVVSKIVNNILKEGYMYGRHADDKLSPEEKKQSQMEDDWYRAEEKPYDYYTANNNKYNHNVHDDAIRHSGAKKHSRLDSFDDTKRGNSVRKFNGTLDSIIKK